MHRAFTRFPMVLFPILACAVQTPNTWGKVAFVESGFKDAVQMAAKENKPVMLEFYAEWCGPCKLMDRRTWPDATVEAISRYFVNLKLDGDTKEAEPFQSKYRVMAYPTVVFLGPNGQEVTREMGFLGPKEVVRMMLQVLEKTSKNGLLKLAQSPDSPPRMSLLVAKRLIGEKQWMLAEELLQAARKKDPGADMEAELLLSEAELGFGKGDKEKGLADYRRFLQGFPEHPRVGKTVTLVADALVEAGKPEEAVALYRDVVKARPDNVGLLNGFAWFCATKGLALEEALQKGERALELSNRTAGVLDTVAETHFRRGELEQALRLIDEAIQKAPRDPYYKEQKAKFSAAKKSHSPDNSPQ